MLAYPGAAERVEMVTDLAISVAGFSRPSVTVALTNFRLLVIDECGADAGSGADLTASIPLGLIQACSKAGPITAPLSVRCKDFRTLTLALADPAADEPWLLMYLYNKLSQCCAVLGEEPPCLAPNLASPESQLPESRDWLLDLQGEFNRQFGDASWDADGSFRDAGNGEYQLCETYPSLVLVPANLSDEVIEGCVKFRSKRRLPALTWRDSKTGTCIYRCAQPKPGITGHVSEADEMLVVALKSDDGGSGQLSIFDCRSQTAAVANSAKGAGAEDISRYTGCTQRFLDIGNIHAMRHSLDSLQKIIADDDTSSFDDKEDAWLERLSGTQWLYHTRLVLRSAMEVALAVRAGANALVHCSDGWDRTSQICALAQLLLDPYYRTLAGFRVLVQKDFCAFGHMCKQRLGTVLHADQRSPCLLQFLEAVHHCLAQIPAAFEFNDLFLQVRTRPELPLRTLLTLLTLLTLQGTVSRALARAIS